MAIGPKRCISRVLACTVKNLPALRFAPPAPATSGPRTELFWSIPIRVLAANCALGHAHTGRVDRIYNQSIPEEDRVPACVRACPTGARAFGDLGDPDSAVSQSVAERDGFNLLDSFGYKPVNKYLPPRKDNTPAEQVARETPPDHDTGSAIEKLFAWADRALTR